VDLADAKMDKDQDISHIDAKKLNPGPAVVQSSSSKTD
jgi:hypothetical protein